MQDVAFYDVETKSLLDLKKVGQYRYAADKSTQLLCAAWAINDEPIQLWLPGQPVPKTLAKHVSKGGLLVAHGAGFELQIHRQILSPVHGWPIPEIRQYRCSQAMALALALPAALENTADAVGLEVGKDKVGKRVMMQMVKPRRAKKGEDDSKVYWHEDAAKAEALYNYCIQDVNVTRQIYDLMWPLTDEEQLVWEMDQRINDRGFYVDEKLLLAMRRIITDAGFDIDKQLVEKTKGFVMKVGEVAKIKTWMQEKFKLDIDSLNKTTIPVLMADQKVPQLAKDVLELRLSGAQAAVKKVDAFLSRRSKDGRVRGAFVYHSAGTGRWSSRGAQVHNLKRLTSEDQDEIGVAVDDLMKGDYQLLKTKYKDERPLQIVGDNIRTVICAAPGNVLIGADFSGIEARVTAWVAGEMRKIKVFQDYDAGKGPDPYVAAAADIFGLTYKEMADLKNSDPNEYKIKRQAGKGCFAADTLVLTNHGIKQITEVTTGDSLWDGQQWVKHNGLTFKGLKKTINLNGVEVTPDHLIAIGKTWKRADQLASNEKLLCQALATGSANLPLLGINMNLPVDVPTSLRNVRAELSHIESRSTICVAANPPDAISALKSKAVTGVRIFGDTLTSFLMTNIVGVFSTVFQPASPVALPKIEVEKINTMPIMAGEVFEFLKDGHSASKDDASFLPTLSHLKAGIIRSSKWIGLILTGITNRGIFGLLQKVKAKNDQSKSCKLASMSWKPVYDLVNAGPLHRFTVLTPEGKPLIVHNSELAFGFGGAENAYKKFMPESMLANPGPHVKPSKKGLLVKIAKAPQLETADKDRGPASEAGASSVQAKTAKVDPALVGKFTDEQITDIMTKWRKSHSNIQSIWYGLGEATTIIAKKASAILRGLDVEVHPIPVNNLWFEFDNGYMFMVLPSGRRISYPGINRAKDYRERYQIQMPDGSTPDTPVGKMSTYFMDNSGGRAHRVWMWHGTVIENAVQGIARDLLSEAMIRIEKAGLPIVGHVHDECLLEVPKRGAEKVAKQFVELMTELPSWAQNTDCPLPIKASPFIAERYVK